MGSVSLWVVKSKLCNAQSPHRLIAGGGTPQQQLQAGFCDVAVVASADEGIVTTAVSLLFLRSQKAERGIDWVHDGFLKGFAKTDCACCRILGGLLLEVVCWSSSWLASVKGSQQLTSGGVGWGVVSLLYLLACAFLQYRYIRVVTKFLLHRFFTAKPCNHFILSLN
jgi:hypothetical protein